MVIFASTALKLVEWVLHPQYPWWVFQTVPSTNRFTRVISRPFQEMFRSISDLHRFLAS